LVKIYNLKSVIICLLLVRDSPRNILYISVLFCSLYITHDRDGHLHEIDKLHAVIWLFQWGSLFDRPFGLGLWPQDHGCLVSVTARTCKEFPVVAWADHRLTRVPIGCKTSTCSSYDCGDRRPHGNAKIPLWSLLDRRVGLGRRSQDHCCWATEARTCSEFPVVRRAERSLIRVRRSEDCFTAVAAEIRQNPARSDRRRSVWKRSKDSSGSPWSTLHAEFVSAWVLLTWNNIHKVRPNPLPPWSVRCYLVATGQLVFGVGERSY